MSLKEQQAAERGQTLFVCVRDRGGKSTSCAGSGARMLLSDMRTMLAREGIEPEELTIRPCGCLGLCKQGPAFIAVQSKAKKPPKIKKKRRQAEVFKKVAANETRDVLRSVLSFHRAHVTK